MRRTVKDVMTEGVVVAHESTPYKEIASLMDSNDVSALPVVDQNGILIGIVSEADLLLKEEHPAGARKPHRLEMGRHRAEERKAAGTNARQLMTSPVVTARPDTPIAEAARVMHQRGVKRLPVIDSGGRLVGIVSRKDLLHVFLRSDEEIRREVIDDVMVAKLWLDPRDAGVQVEVGDGVVRLQGRLERKSVIEILVGLVYGVEGVVDVEDRLSFSTDDTRIDPESPLPWGVLPKALRRP